ncbi:MAG TPA: RDD family protein [Acidimicrobiales bacterium]|nr:RDD family protein [Acidimicrobiales bacterium]
MYCSNCGALVPAGRCPACDVMPTTSASGRDDATTGLVLASFWRRAGSRVADDLLLIIPGVVIFALVAALSNVVVAWIAFFALTGGYVIGFLIGPAGQTLGGRVASTRVRDARSGKMITLRQASLRWGFVTLYGSLELAGSHWAYAVVAFSLIDNLYLFVDPRRQTLHDKFASTIVVMA